MRMVDIIAKKRDGHELLPEEIAFFVNGFVSGDIPDYQMAALLMAIYLKDLSHKETAVLIDAMLHSGETIDLTGIAGVKVDKHSTGGVGDKTSLVLAPLVAAAGVPVAKMSGRGLGHTGGTIDKLESFTGFSVEMSSEEFVDRVNRHGIAICGQSKELVPADKMIYALRDVTATVDHIPLIAGSIMSKKLAMGADAIVLDVKCGSGAFMKDQKSAVALALTMVEAGKAMGKETVALVTDMDQPLGNAIGNALEVKEALESLQGRGPQDFMELVYALGSRMVVLGQKAHDLEEGRKMLEDLISSGAAFAKFKEFIATQGGDADQADFPETLPAAKYMREVKAPESGFIHRLEADLIGHASMLLGAGRATKADVIDLGAGIMLRQKRGDRVAKGQVLAELYANKESLFAEAEKVVLSAYKIGKKAVPGPDLVLKVV
ncbi:MAG: pyrimidine-nucleoside phosphorylase [Bacteroidia bacterium]|nr:pyrimidine-nucleoside phosphorylase [Bacteroidia bacterium]